METPLESRDEKGEGGSANGKPMISQRQYNRLMEMINKQNLNNGISTTPHNSATTMLPGKSFAP